MKHPLESLVSAAAILLLAMLSCLLLPAPQLRPDLAASLAANLHITPATLYMMLLCLWFIGLGVVEYLVVRYVWRRWLAVS